MNLSVIPFNSTHIEEIAELEKLCFTSPWSENTLRLLLEENAIAFVSLVDGKICGYCGALFVLDEADITSVAVNPLYRRQKVASALLTNLTRVANEKGIKSLTLEVRENNKAAIELYKSFFFVPVGRIKNYYNNPSEDAIIMKRSQE